MKRREIIKLLSAAPIAGGIIGSVVPGLAFAAPAKSKRNLIKELGLRSFINAAGNYTHMTASIMPDEVLETIAVTAKEFVMLDEVQDKVGEKIAAICHAEAATVTAGCWSAVVLGTAGVLTGMDQKKVSQLPNLEGMKSEVIVQNAHNFAYVHALTNTGAKIVAVETAREFENAINEKTAMTWFLNVSANEGKIHYQEWLAIAKRHNIPSMIDMAADVPPVENLWKYNDMGFDLVCISGGKAIRGPQSAGILMGRKDLIAAARLSAPPRGGNIGRGMKVNKEEILGMYVALEKYVNTDHKKEWKIWEDRIAVIENAVKNVPGITTEIFVPPIANHAPVLGISWDNNQIKLSGNELMGKLRNGNPSIEVMPGKNGGINVVTFTLKAGQEKIVAKRIREELNKAVG